VALWFKIPVKLHHKIFEMRHYGMITVQEFNEIKDSSILNTSGKTHKLLCLVSAANHRLSRLGNKFGSFILEDYTGKMEIVLFGDDYVRYHPYMQQGQAIFISGAFKQRFNKSEFEFKLSSVVLAENVKRQMTKQLQLEMDVRNIEKETIDFLDQNIKNNPGKSTLKLVMSEPKNNWTANLKTLDNGFEMNNELIDFLKEKPEIEVQVTAG
jgi:DNA polymerase-3 subunit alpha